MKCQKRRSLAVRRWASRAAALGLLGFLLVAGSGCPSLFQSDVQRAVKVKQAIPGRDGAKTVSATNTILNAYAALSADVAAGAASITVVNIADLNSNFTAALAKGDLLLVIQMQGATIDTSDTVAYGTVSNLNSAGRYELVGVEDVTVATNTIALACPLRNAYTAAGNAQVVRVPQYTTLTIGAGASITAPPWDGNTGGVVAVHAQTTVQLDGSIDVSGKGFRGGAVDNSSNAANTVTTLYRSALQADGAEKGESIAGYQTSYVNGRYGRGAPANGGGGGNSHNAGGGGGANAGNPAGWQNGQGVMLGTVVGAGAWALDPGYINNPAGANTRTSSEGGGRGGYSYSANDQDALTVGPGDASWGGNNRRELGGLGGRPLASSPTGRLFLGGGGGAGDRNNGSAGCAGGNGGGLVFLMAGTVSGAGSIIADGADAPAAPGGAGGGDAPGGGGGGGTVVVNAATLAATVNITANGGLGGNHTGSGSQDEVEGPGGGGGGGYIAVSGGTPARTASGALGGTTTRTALSEFPSDGATAGHDGIVNGDASSFLYCGALPVTTIATHPSNPTTATTGSFTFTNTSSPVTYECKIDSGSFAACTTPFTTGTLAAGSHTLSVQATDSFGNQEATPVTFTWTIGTSALTTTIATHPNAFSNDPTGDFTFTNTTSPVTYECKLDNGAFASCSTPYTTTALVDGTHTLSVRATDSGNVVEDPPVTFTWTLDTVAPETRIDSAPPNPSVTSIGTFVFGSNESPVTFQCVLDQAPDGGVADGGIGEWTTCAATYTTPVLLDGSHTLQVRAVDQAGNVDATPTTFTWTVNTALPLTTIVTHPGEFSNDPTGDFTFTNTRDPGVTYECKLDNGSFTACATPYTTPTLADGPHTLSVRGSAVVTDAGALVENPPVTFTWTIDTVVPDTKIETGPTNPSPSPTGAFTFSSSESPVTYQCQIDGGDWGTCAASYVTPALDNGSHTLAVRAIDRAGNVDATPATFTWTIEAPVGLDGGVTILDGGNGEGGIVVLDGGLGLDGQRPDVPGASDAGPIDTTARDVNREVADLAADAPADVQAAGPEPGPEPNRDAASVNEDTAEPIATEDAAVNGAPGKVLGGGFCAIAPTRSGSPAALALLAFAAVALLRRRRR